MAAPGEESARDRLELLDWKARISALYVEVRAARDPAEAWEHWRRVRDELFGSHPQSPLPAAARAGFAGLDYFPYDPGLRVDAEVPTSRGRYPRQDVQVDSSGGRTDLTNRVAGDVGGGTRSHTCLQHRGERGAILGGLSRPLLR